MADAVDALYVMFDADIMAAEWVPGFYRAEPGGLSREEVLERLACVMETGKVVAASTWCFDFDREPEAVRVNAESQGAVVQEILTGLGIFELSESKSPIAKPGRRKGAAGLSF